jgi:hypothetical protein
MHDQAYSLNITPLGFVRATRTGTLLAHNDNVLITKRAERQTTLAQSDFSEDDTDATNQNNTPRSTCFLVIPATFAAEKPLGKHSGQVLRAIACASVMFGWLCFGAPHA